MTKAVIYTRVSTDEQANNGYSLQHQEFVLNQYCNLNNIEIVQHYKEDFSAKTFNRPEVQKAFEFIKNNKKNIDVFLFTRWDRFSRNQDEAIQAIKMLRNYGLTVNAIEQPLDLDNPDHKMLLSIYLIIPEIENDKNSQRTKDGMRRAMKEGCFMGKAPIGYKHHRDENGNSTLIPNEEIAALIRVVFDEFSTGLYSANELRLKYAKKGLKTSKQGFVNMLRNVIYIGKIFIPEFKKEPDETVEGLHPALITEDTFKKVKFILSCKKKPQVNTTTNDELLPLRQILICPKCGKKYTGGPSKGNGGKYLYYHCQSRCTGNHGADEVHNLLNVFLKRFEIKEEIRDLYEVILEEKFSDNSKNREARITCIKKEVKILQEKILKLEDSIGDSDVPTDRIMKIIERHEQKIYELKQEEEMLCKTDKEFNTYLKFGISFLGGLSTYYNSSNSKVKKMILGSIFPEKLIFDGKNYRTVKENELLGLLFNNNNTSAFLGMKKAILSNGFSTKAPLSFDLSNQLIEDLKKIYDLRGFINVPSMTGFISSK